MTTLRRHVLFPFLCLQLQAGPSLGRLHNYHLQGWVAAFWCSHVPSPAEDGGGLVAGKADRLTQPQNPSYLRE